MLPSEATHSSLHLFEKPSLLVAFDGSFCQKLGPIYSPNGPMLEFEFAGDRNNFIDLQNFLVRQSAECTFYGKIAVDFFTCDRHLLSGVTFRIAFRR